MSMLPLSGPDPTNPLWQWSVVHADTGQVIWVGFTTEEASYHGNKASVPPGYLFVDVPPDQDRTHIGRYMAYDTEKKEFFYDKDKIDAAGMTLDGVKALSEKKPEGTKPAVVNAWDTVPKKKPTRAE